MSNAVTFERMENDRSSLISEIVWFYRRWLACETILDPNALEEIGLGHLAIRR